LVYWKSLLAGRETVLDSLACYPRRVAISNHRVREVGEGFVRFHIHRCPACGSLTLIRVALLAPIRSFPASSTSIRAPPCGREAR
jgi:hypothetical protein